MFIMKSSKNSPMEEYLKFKNHLEERLSDELSRRKKLKISKIIVSLDQVKDSIILDIAHKNKRSYDKIIKTVTIVDNNMKEIDEVDVKKFCDLEYRMQLIKENK